MLKLESQVQEYVPRMSSLHLRRQENLWDVLAAQLVSSRTSGRPCLKKIGWRVSEEQQWTLTSGLQQTSRDSFAEITGPLTMLPRPKALLQSLARARLKCITKTQPWLLFADCYPHYYFKHLRQFDFS